MTEIIGETDGVTDARKVVIPIAEYDVLLMVAEEAKVLCNGWQDDQRRWLHVAVDAKDISTLRDAVARLEAMGK